MCLLSDCFPLKKTQFQCFKNCFSPFRNETGYKQLKQAVCYREIPKRQARYCAEQHDTVVLDNCQQQGRGLAMGPRRRTAGGAAHSTKTTRFTPIFPVKWRLKRKILSSITIILFNQLMKIYFKTPQILLRSFIQDTDNNGFSVPGPIIGSCD